MTLNFVKPFDKPNDALAQGVMSRILELLQVCCRKGEIGSASKTVSGIFSQSHGHVMSTTTPFLIERQRRSMCISMRELSSKLLQAMNIFNLLLVLAVRGPCYGSGAGADNRASVPPLEDTLTFLRGIKPPTISVQGAPFS